MIEKHGQHYHSRGVRFRYQGERSAPIPPRVIAAINWVEDATASATKLTLTFAFNYGGRREIVAACRKLLREGTDADSLSEERFAAAFQFPDAPDPDLIVRTANEHRLSNFLLWQAAYAEFIFLDIPWPDFRERHFHEVLDVYAERTRTFGAVSVALTGVPAR